MSSGSYYLAAIYAFFFLGGGAFKNPAANPPNPSFFFLTGYYFTSGFFCSSTESALDAAGLSKSKSSLGAILVTLASCACSFLGASRISSVWSADLIPAAYEFPSAFYLAALLALICSVMSSKGGGISSSLSDIVCF